MKKKQILILILLFALLIILSIKVHNKDILNIDITAYSLIVEKLRNPTLTNIMKTITTLGNPHNVIIICLITSAIIFLKNKPLSLIVPLNLVVTTCLNQFIKLIIKRPRPTGYRLINIGGYSFPSGHAMISVAFYGLYIYIINKTIKNKTLRIILDIVLLLIILLIGVSRIYLGVHYLSDILAGYITSTIYLLIITKILNKYVLK